MKSVITTICVSMYVWYMDIHVFAWYMSIHVYYAQVYNVEVRRGH